jgi:Spy/CpxP family protein refolding chaperone
MQGGMAGMGRSPAVVEQMAELRAKMQRLETTLQQQSGAAPGTHGSGVEAGTIPPSGPMAGMVSPGMAAMPGMESAAKPMQGKMAGMSGMGAPGGMKPAGDLDGMGGGASPSGEEMGMMSMRDKMMEKMMSKGGGGKMGMDKMEMAGMGGGSPSGGGMGMMDMDKMEMAGMMGMMGGMGGKGGSGMAMPSALPGFPGASHLYHIGATGFFLDHPQHIALSTEQQMRLNQIKQQAALDKASASRSVEEAEQDLWTLTAADQPDNAQIEAKVAEIEKIKGDARLRFISAIGGAAQILTDDQRRSLTGFAPPHSAAPMAGHERHVSEQPTRR